MRRHEVLFRKRALRDLEDIFEAVAIASGSRAVAAQYRDRIIATCSRIGDAPEGGRNRDAIRPGLRTWTFERRMIIAYLVERGRVRITRIVDGRRDYPKLLASNRPRSS